MKQRLAVVKYFKPSIVLTVLAILATLFAHPHIIVPIVLVTGAVIMAWQNYRILRVRNKLQEQEQEVDEIQAVD
ncbi:unnamed protein product [marine sediment metagenome]|uniref:Uncharacterized protein n=1 Tax=marine sediment metagenome TaxID=412755 RepID=X1C895_9ZZZZ